MEILPKVCISWEHIFFMELARCIMTILFSLSYPTWENLKDSILHSVASLVFGDFGETGAAKRGVDP